jgi:hypothetical protein
VVAAAGLFAWRRTSLDAGIAEVQRARPAAVSYSAP